MRGTSITQSEAVVADVVTQDGGVALHQVHRRPQRREPRAAAVAETRGVDVRGVIAVVHLARRLVHDFEPHRGLRAECAVPCISIRMGCPS